MNPSAHSETADGVCSPSTSDRKHGSNREAQKLAHDLVLKAQALSSSVQKMPPSSPVEDARRGFNLKHLNILANRFAELAALSTELEDENTQLRRKLAKAEKDLKISHYEKLDLERECTYERISRGTAVSQRYAGQTREAGRGSGRQAAKCLQKISGGLEQVQGRFNGGESIELIANSRYTRICSTVSRNATSAI